MALNPLRDGLARAGLDPFRMAPAFRDATDAALGGFRKVRSDLVAQVRRGDLTPKVARRLAAEAAATMADDLRRRGQEQSTAPRAMAERLAAAQQDRSRSRSAAFPPSLPLVPDLLRVISNQPVSC